jgi:soluble lytic murein transglycosylase-like protein
MSVQPIIGAALEEGPAGPVAAAQRIQHLQALIAGVEEGPAGFAAALKAAQTSPPAQVLPGGAYPASAGASTLTPATSILPSATASSPSTSYTPASGSAVLASPTTANVPTGAGSSGAGYDPLIEQAAARNGVDPAVLHGLIQQESGFDPHATSSAGALGLTQLMPGTAASLGVTDPLDPAQSIEGGARYLGQMLHEFGGNTEKALVS